MMSTIGKRIRRHVEYSHDMTAPGKIERRLSESEVMNRNGVLEHRCHQGSCGKRLTQLSAGENTASYDGAKKYAIARGEGEGNREEAKDAKETAKRRRTRRGRL
jgi:hypothetical protein